MTSNRTLLILIAAGALTALAVVYALIDPAEAVWMPKCPVHFLTGFDCPGCGSQRAVHALLRGDMPGAFRANAFLMGAIPFVGLLAYAELTKRRHPRLYRRVCSSAVIICFLGLLAVWTVFRNICLR